MGRPKIGDKVFLYGQFMQLLEDFDEFSYNSLLGHTTIGGYCVELEKNDNNLYSVPGFVVDFQPTLCLTSLASFTELRDITDKLAKQLPLASDTVIWTPY